MSEYIIKADKEEQSLRFAQKEKIKKNRNIGNICMKSKAEIVEYNI